VGAKLWLPVWLGLHAVATAKTASTSTTGTTAAKALHSELHAGVRTVQGYTVCSAPLTTRRNSWRLHNLPYGREAALGAGCGGGLVTVLTRSFHQSMHSFAETLKSIAEGTVTWMTG
jgi:hypothetical protein